MPLPLTVIPIPGPRAEDVLVGDDGRVWTGPADGVVHAHDPATGCRARAAVRGSSQARPGVL